MDETEPSASPQDYGPICDAAIQAGDTSAIERLHDELQTKNTIYQAAKDRSLLSYYQGNLCSAWSSLENETADGWRSGKFPVKRTSAIDNFRRALKLDPEASFSWRDQARTNLGNELAHQGRGIEALAYWIPRLPSRDDAGFVSALSRARELMSASYWISDDGHLQLFQFEAYRQARELDRHRRNTDHPGVVSALGTNGQLRQLIDYGDANWAPLEGWQGTYKPDSRSQSEFSYRDWCLKHRLFANPVNLLTDRWIAAADILQFPNHFVKVSEGPFFSSAFSSIKREYCFARFLAYEGLEAIHPSWENEKLYLTDTLDGVCFDGATEKLKTALRVCFGVFDSLAFLLNRYFKCDATHCAFSSKWFKNHLSGMSNPFLDALFWLACDLTDTSRISLDIWKAPQAELSDLRRLRNAIEHGWLRIAARSPGIWSQESDFAKTVTPYDFRRLTLLALRVTRSALIYLTMAVKYHEQNQERGPGLTVPTTVPLLDNPEDVAQLLRFRETEPE